MLFSKLTIFKQRQPREFNYIPIYAKDEENQTTETHEDRIRRSYGNHTVSGKTFSERMEERRLRPGYSNNNARSKVIYWISILAIAAALYIFL
jgi:hypothetical protein